MTTTLHTSEAEVQDEVLDIAESLGWTRRPRSEMNAIRGTARMNEAIVEPLLVEAIQDLNNGLSEEEAREIAARVRRISSDREMLDVLRKGVQFKRSPAEDTKDIVIVDSLDPSRNDYVVTDEFVIRTGGHREPQLDVVFLVNGIPLGAIENKDTDEPLEKAADDWRGYWGDAPQLIAQTSVIGCCNGLELLVGPSGLPGIDGYMRWKDPWPLDVDDPDDPMLVTLTGAFHPHRLVDLAANFVLFETQEGVTKKKLARSHQYRAANKIVARVVDGELKRGLIWHATGSGKSLTMVFAGRKLMRAGLGNPHVLIVVDRTELDEQINETLTACEFDGVERAKTRDHLRQLLSSSAGGATVTTMHKFDKSMSDLLEREEVIAFVDEAHRTQFGRFAIWMRKALPNASMYGFTGTPVEKDGRSTQKAFCPELPTGGLEAYLDRYGFDEATADGAIVPLVYESRLADWQVKGADLEAKFAALTPGMDEEERNALRRQATGEKVIAKSPARVRKIAADIVEQLDGRFTPLGLVGQAVVCDRQAAALLAAELAKLLPPVQFGVCMSRSKKDSAPRPGEIDIREWYPAVHWERVHGAAPDANEAGDQDLDDGFVSATDRSAIKDFIDRFKRDDDPLRLLIVNRMLITGFDAPNEGVLFLDQALTDHNLMQAINRPNRRHPAKDAAVIIDYWGVFDHLSAALEEFATEDLAGLIDNSEKLVERFPRVIDEALEVVKDAPEGSARRRMLWLVRRFTDDPDEGQRFERLVQEAQSIFEILAPDPRLAADLDRYEQMLGIWLSWVRGSRRDKRKAENAELRHKTQTLVQEAIGVGGFKDDLPAATIDADFLEALAEQTAELTPEEKATDIEAAVVHEIKVRDDDDPRAQTLAERLARLREKQSKQAQMTIEALGEWAELVREHVEEDERAEDLGLSEPGALALASLRRSAEEPTDAVLIEVAREIDEIVRGVASFRGWSERSDVRQELRKQAVAALVSHAETRELARHPEVLDELLAALASTDQEA